VKKAPATVDRGPLLGALLRRAHQEVQAHLDDTFRAMGEAPPQGAVGQPLFDHPEGLRATHLARLAGITKQSMAEMIDAMVESGYVERVPDPSDGRARLVRLTSHGRKLAVRAREAVREVEARWAARVGAARIEALRATLAALVSAT
jgi:DNA-binding MarR family transcriptional regulator